MRIAGIGREISDRPCCTLLRFNNRSCIVWTACSLKVYRWKRVTCQREVADTVRDSAWQSQYSVLTPYQALKAQWSPPNVCDGDLNARGLVSNTEACQSNVGTLLHLAISQSLTKGIGTDPRVWRPPTTKKTHQYPKKYLDSMEEHHCLSIA